MAAQHALVLLPLDLPDAHRAVYLLISADNLGSTASTQVRHRSVILFWREFRIIIPLRIGVQLDWDYDLLGAPSRTSSSETRRE